MSPELAHTKRWQSYREHEKQRTDKACAGTADLTHSARRLGSHAPPLRPKRRKHETHVSK